MGFLGKKKGQQADFGLFMRACGQAQTGTMFLLRVSDLYPVFVSESFQRVFGVEPGRLADDVETLYRFVPDEARLAAKRQLAGWDHSSPVDVELPYRMPDGSQDKHFRLRVSAVLEDTHLLVEATDVTAENAKLVAYAKDREQAVASARERTDFMSQMSHEIRTPLTGIKGLIGLARNHADDAERLDDDLSRAGELSNYLLSLINDVLDMSRLNSGHVELEQMPFDLRLMAEDLRGMFAVQAADKGLTFAVELEQGAHPYVVGDRMRLNQVVVNFLSNALKFTDEGGLVEVSFREMYLDEGQVSYMIRVRDTGKGMDPRFVSRIFKPFEQEDRTIARRYGGTGLGMAITSGLVDLMGGKIVVDTELGRGSDFTVYVSFALATAEQIAELEANGDTLETRIATADTALEYSFEGKRLLLAEDNDLNAMIAIEVLGNLGAEVDRASDGPVVVQMFEASAPGYYDAILMDIQMPTLNGWEAARQIRELARPDAASVPIIALSANNYTEDARKSREAGMNGHAGKPIDFAELKAQLAAATAETAYRGRS